MRFSPRSGWWLAVGLCVGCGPLEAPDEAEAVGTSSEALTNACQDTKRDYTFPCTTVRVYKTATSTTAIDTIQCGGALWVVNLVQACPSNGRFLADYGKSFDSTPARGWIDRAYIVP